MRELSRNNDTVGPARFALANRVYELFQCFPLHTNIEIAINGYLGSLKVTYC